MLINLHFILGTLGTDVDKLAFYTWYTWYRFPDDCTISNQNFHSFVCSTHFHMPHICASHCNTSALH